MTHEQIIRAWKDEDYRRGLTGEELSALPAHPAGLVELSDQSLVDVAGRDEAVTLVDCIIVATWFFCLPYTIYLITKAANCLPNEE